MRKDCFVLIFCFVSWAGLLNAQQDTGSARERVGIVMDAKNQEPLLGAAVLVKGSTTGTTCDWDGVFRIPVRSGDTLSISYVGYRSQLVVMGNTAADTLYIYMHEDTEVLEEVAVVAKRRTNSDMAVLQATKQALTIQEGISSEQIKRSQDKDAAEVIRRVPGISLIDDKFVMVRGLSQRYNQVWLNGAAVPSSEADSRAFSFDLLPSSQLDNMVIVKSPTPEYPADFSGGMVLITTRDVPDYSSWSVSLAGAMNDQTHCQPFLTTASAPYKGTDIMGKTLSGFEGIANSVSLTGNGLNNDWRVKQITPVSDLSLAMNGSESWRLPQNQTFSLLVAANYSRSYKHYRDMLNNLFGAYDEEKQQSTYLRHSTDDQQTIHNRAGAMLNLSYSRREGKDRIELKNILNYLDRERYTDRVGISAQNDEERQAEYSYQSRLTYSAQLSGKHEVAGQKGKLHWDIGYAYSNRNQPDRRRYLINDALEVGLLQLSSSNDISREFTYLYEHIASLAIGYEQQVEWGWFKPTWKGGAYAEYRTRDYRTRMFYYNWNQSNNTLPANFRQLDIPTELMTDANYGEDKLYLLEQVKWRNNYEGQNILCAGYVGINMPFGPVDVYAGVRYEYARMTLVRNTRDREYSPLATHYPTSDFFPSLNATYRVNAHHQLRASYGMSINRPEFREVSPSVYYDFELASNVQGNVDLQACRIQNADLRYEFYPSDKSEVISIALFYKHFRNPIEWTYTVTGGTDLTYSYQNADRAFSYGAEIDLRKDLSFMGMRGFQFSFNGALIRSRVLFPEGSRELTRPMQGQSPYLINTGLFYAHDFNDQHGISCAVLYNRIGKRLIGVGRSVGLTGGSDVINIPDSYEMPRNALDLNIGYTWTMERTPSNSPYKSTPKIKDFSGTPQGGETNAPRKPSSLSIRFAAKDVIGEAVVYQQIGTYSLPEGKTQEVKETTRSFRPGRNFTLTLQYQF